MKHGEKSRRPLSPKTTPRKQYDAVEQQEESGEAGKDIAASSSSSSYRNVLSRNKQYRWYLAAKFCQRFGETFVRIANLVAVQDLAPGKQGTALALLATYSLLPKVICSQIGGYLADMHDRRKLMIQLDVLAAIVSLLFLVALRFESLALIFLATLLRSTVYSTYLPIENGIITMLVPPEDLQTAVTMNNWAYSAMTCLGGIIAGVAAADIGLGPCYWIDCITYIASAFLMYCISGNYSVFADNGGTSSRERVLDGGFKRDSEDSSTGDEVTDSGISRLSSSWSRYCNSCRRAKDACSVSLAPMKEVTTYILSCGFGWLVILDGSSALVWGPQDILGVSLSTVEGDEEKTRFRVGFTVTVIGLGMLAGPTLTNQFISSHKDPAALQATCIWGIGVMALGWVAVALAASYGDYKSFLVGTFIRTLGSGTVYVGSTLLLQMLTESQFLGRTLALAATGDTIMEALSATISGQILDRGRFANNNATLSWFGATMGALVTTIWTIYHLRGGAAAQHSSKLEVEVASIRNVRSNTMPLDEEEDIHYQELT